MIRWEADPELASLLRRYYEGEGGLWNEIHRRVDAELRQREVPLGAYHFRFRATKTGYEILVEDARDYVVNE